MTRQAILIGFTLWVLNATAPPYKRATFPDYAACVVAAQAEIDSSPAYEENVTFGNYRTYDLPNNCCRCASYALDFIRTTSSLIIDRPRARSGSAAVWGRRRNSALLVYR